MPPVIGTIIRGKDPSVFNEAEEYIQQGITIGKETENKRVVAEGSYFLGKLFANRGSKNKALEHLKRAEEFFRAINFAEGLKKVQELREKLQGNDR